MRSQSPPLLVLLDSDPVNNGLPQNRKLFDRFGRRERNFLQTELQAINGRDRNASSIRLYMFD